MATATIFDRDDWARHYATNHCEIDDGVDVIDHLPDRAGERESRLLEVNREVPELVGLDPISFGVRSHGCLDHSITVLDVTPTQWESIRDGRLPLPPGWSLNGSRRLDRQS